MVKPSSAKIITDNDKFFSKYELLLKSCSLEVDPLHSRGDIKNKISSVPFDIFVIDNEKGTFPYDEFFNNLDSNHSKKFLINIGSAPPEHLKIPFPFLHLNTNNDQIPLSLFIKNADKLIRREKAQLELSTMLLHDVRSPLNSLIGYLELLINGTFGGLNEGHKNIIEKAIEMGDNALELLEELHEIFREDPESLLLQKHICNFNQILDDVLAIVWVKADKKNIQIKKNINSKLDEVFAEDFQIQRLLTNLFTNSIKYSPINSCIIIKTEREENQYLKISIIDSGQGVPEEDISFLFDKYFRVKQKNKFKDGYGLGLYICKIIVKSHGGKIWAKNNEHGGLTVTFTLPLAKNSS